MKRFLLLLLWLAAISPAGTLFTGVTANQVASASTFQTAAGDQQFNLYASGPTSGTWTATVHFYKLRGDGALSLLATMNLSSSGPNTDGTGTRTYDQLGVNIGGGSYVFADVTNVTGTIPAPGLFAENK